MNSNGSRNVEVRTVIFVVAIVAFGLFLRTVKLGNVPFQNTDDASTAWAATWYFPRGWSSFQLGNGSSEPNPIGIITLSHGPLQAIIAYAWVNLVALFGIQVSEFVWHLPFAILGGISVFITYLLGVKLQSHRAGLFSALLVSVIPLHVAFSRSSGESHYLLASLLQTAGILLWWQYLVSQKKLIALIVGFILACDILTDFAFPGFILTLFFTSLVYHRSHTAKVPSFQALSDLMGWRLVVPALVSISIHGYAIVKALSTKQGTGMFGRLFSQSQSVQTKVGGFFLDSALENIIYVTNIVTVITLIIGIVAFIAAKKYRTSGASIALFWAAIYLLPFLFLFERDRLVGHFIPISVAFCVFIGFIFDKLYDSGNKIIAASVIGLTYISLILSTMSTVYGVQLQGVLNHPQDHGSIGTDRGTKTAAFWVRQNTAPGTILFTDPYAQEGLPVSLYYYHRPIVSLELVPETTLERSFELLSKKFQLIDVIIIGYEHLDRLPKEVIDQCSMEAVITVNNEISLYILSKAEEAQARNGAPMIMEANVFNSRYDKLYSDLKEIVALPFEDIQSLQAEMDQ